MAYVRAQVEHGASREEIVRILKTEGGWEDEDILGAFAMVGSVGLQEVDTKDSFSEYKKKEESNVSISEKPEKREKSKKGLVIVLFIIIIGLAVGGVFAYYKFMIPEDMRSEVEDTATEEEILEENSEVVEQEEIERAYALIERSGVYYVQGKLILPDGIVEKPTDIINTSATLELFPIMEDGTFEVIVLPDQINVIAAMLPDKEFGFMKVMGPDDLEDDPYALIDAQSSAVAFVFLSPYLISEELEVSELVLFVARENKKVENFAGVVTEKSVNAAIPLDDEEYTEAFGDAIESVLEDMNSPEEEEEEKG